MRFPISILFVEDNQTMRFWFSEVLGEKIDKLYIASNGSEGIEFYKKYHPELVITDIEMPKINGLEMLKQIKKINPNAKSIVISAYNLADYFINCIELGVDGFILKPIITEHLIEIVKKVARNIINERELNEKTKALEESENKYRTLVETAKDGIAMFDLNYKRLYENTAFYSILGYTKMEFDSLADFERIHSDDIEPIKQGMAEIFVNQKSSVQYRFLHKNNYWVFLNSNASLILNSNGSPSGILVIVHDITEQKRNEEHILNVIVETEEKEKSHFAQELHDGLGPILSTTKFYLQTLLDSESPEMMKKVSDKLHKTIDEAILCLTEISNNLSPHILKNFGLISAVKSATDKLKESSKISINFEFEFNERLKDILEITIYRIVIELIHNTIKHAHAKNIKISLSKKDEKILLEYFDDGKGFDIKKAFESPKGMGLFNIKNRLKTLNGELIVESESGKGSHFQITINSILPDIVSNYTVKS